MGMGTVAERVPGVVVVVVVVALPPPPVVVVVGTFDSERVKSGGERKCYCN